MLHVWIGLHETRRFRSFATYVAGDNRLAVQVDETFNPS
jgi:hypothetical protein